MRAGAREPRWEQIDVRAVEVRPIRPGEAARWDALVRERHYLGLGQLVGESLKYVAAVDGEWVALLGWASAAFKCGPRDRWIGWSPEQRSRRRRFVVNNARFLVLCEERVPNLASRVLALNARRLSVFRLHRKVIHLKSGKVTEETVHGITSLTSEKASPKRLLALIREHWHIENKLHYVRDFTYDEDRSQVRTGNGPRAMCSLRNLAIALIRSYGWPGIPTGLRHYAAHPQEVLNLIGA